MGLTGGVSTSRHAAAPPSEMRRRCLSHAQAFFADQDLLAMQNISQDIRDFIVSTGVLELVAFLEQHFEIAVADRELLPENLDSVTHASAFVGRKLEARA